MKNSEKLTLDDWLDCVQPDQKQEMKELVEQMGAEDAAKTWYEDNAQDQMIVSTPPGVMRLCPPRKPNWEKFRKAFDDVVCGAVGGTIFSKEDAKGVIKDVTKAVLAVLAVKSALSSVLSPIVAVLLYLALETTRVVYCRNRGYEMKAEKA